jgi:hypothetical protein
MAHQINTENSPDFSVEENEALKHASLNRGQYDRLLKMWEEKGSRNWSRRNPKTKGDRERERERKEFCRSLKNKKMIRTFALYGTSSVALRDDLIEALEHTQFDPLYLLNHVGVSPFDVLCEIEKGQEDIADRRELRLQLGNKQKRDSDIDLLEEAVERIRVYERFLNKEISEAYEKEWVERGLIERTQTALPYSTTGRLNALRRMIENHKETFNQLWRLDVINDKNAIDKKGAPTKDEFRLAIASVLHFCNPLFGKDGESLLDKNNGASWRTKRTVLKAKWLIVTAILTYAFPGMFNDVTDKHRFRTMRQRLKNAKRKGKTVNPPIDKLKVEHAIRTVQQQYGQQLSEWSDKGDWYNVSPFESETTSYR